MSRARAAAAPGRWLFLVCLAGIALCLAVPCAALIRESFRTGGGAWSLGNYLAFSRVLFSDHKVPETGKLDRFTLSQCPFD